MSAKCGQCDENVASDPYPDERQVAGECAGFCGQWLCEDCSIEQGGICQACKRELAES
jgi:hypothetical protein